MNARIQSTLFKVQILKQLWKLKFHTLENDVWNIETSSNVFKFHFSWKIHCNYWFFCGGQRSSHCWYFPVQRSQKGWRGKLKFGEYGAKSVAAYEIHDVTRSYTYTRYRKKCFTKIHRYLYGDAVLVPIWMGTNMTDGNQQKHLSTSCATKAWNIPRETHKH